MIIIFEKEGVHVREYTVTWQASAFRCLVPKGQFCLYILATIA